MKAGRTLGFKNSNHSLGVIPCLREAMRPKLGDDD